MLPSRGQCVWVYMHVFPLLLQLVKWNSVNIFHSVNLRKNTFKCSKRFHKVRNHIYEKKKKTIFDRYKGWEASSLLCVFSFLWICTNRPQSDWVRKLNLYDKSWSTGVISYSPSFQHVCSTQALYEKNDLWVCQVLWNS